MSQDELKCFKQLRGIRKKAKISQNFRKRRARCTRYKSSVASETVAPMCQGGTSRPQFIQSSESETNATYEIWKKEKKRKKKKEKKKNIMRNRRRKIINLRSNPRDSAQNAQSRLVQRKALRCILATRMPIQARSQIPTQDSCKHYCISRQDVEPCPRSCQANPWE